MKPNVSRDGLRACSCISRCMDTVMVRCMMAFVFFVCYKAVCAVRELISTTDKRDTFDMAVWHMVG